MDGKLKQDTHQQAVEEFEDAREAVQDQYNRMREDLRFSNPADPQQWDKTAMELRKGRPCLTFDRSNQFISQVVNQGRQNKPAIHCLPANSEADIEVAEQLNGIVRHIEYISRAGIAYDTALEYAARIGLGWLRVVPEIMRPETNEQEIRIKRIADPLACYLEAGWLEPDGSDAMFGFVETMMTMKAFKAAWPKAETDSWEKGSGWFDEKQVRVCEQFKIVETKTPMLKIEMEGQSAVISEDEYWQLRKQTGMEIPAEPFEAKMRSVKWSKLSGCEVLEETDFPSQYLPLVPVIGHELMVDGKRHLCGMTRRLMDSQRAYNYERSAFIESVAMQPKAPLMIAQDAVTGFEAQYAAMNQGNPAYLPFNHADESGNPIPAPTRLQPPAFPVAFAQGGQIATTDMESAVGMFRANLGAPGTAVSGRAKREDKVAGDTANFHYTDNQARSIEQLGRVIVDMIPRVMDTARMARIVAENGDQSFVHVNPEMPTAVQKQGKKVVAINPSVGAYDVRVKTGPAYTTLREEQAEQLANIMQAAPDMVPILADLWVSAQDFPDAEKATKRLQAMLPPQIQQMEDDDGEELSPAVMAQLKQKDDQIGHLSHALEEAAAVADDKQAEQTLKQQEIGIKDKELALKAKELELKHMEAQNKAPPEIAQFKADMSMQAAELQHDREMFAKDKEIALLQLQAKEISLQQAEKQVNDSYESGQRELQIAHEKNTMALQQQADKEKAERESQAKEQEEKAKKEEPKEDIGTHLKPLMDAIKELQSKPKKTQIKIVKQDDGSYVGEKSEA